MPCRHVARTRFKEQEWAAALNEEFLTAIVFKNGLITGAYPTTTVKNDFTFALGVVGRVL